MNDHFETDLAEVKGQKDSSPAKAKETARKHDLYKQVIRDKSLTRAAANTAYCLLFSYLNAKTGRSWPPLKYLARDINCSERHSRDALIQLVEKGYFTKGQHRVPVRGTYEIRTCYTPCFHRLEDFDSGTVDPKMAEPEFQERGTAIPNNSEPGFHPIGSCGSEDCGTGVPRERNQSSHKSIYRNIPREPSKSETHERDTSEENSFEHNPAEFARWPTASQSKTAGDLAKFEKTIAEIFESEGGKCPSDTGFLKVWLQYYSSQTIIDVIQSKMPAAKKKSLKYFDEAIREEHERKSKPDRPVPFPAEAFNEIPF